MRVRDGLSAHGLMLLDNLRLDCHIAAGQYSGNVHITLKSLLILFGQCYSDLIEEFTFIHDVFYALERNKFT